MGEQILVSTPVDCGSPLEGVLVEEDDDGVGNQACHILTTFFFKS